MDTNRLHRPIPSCRKFTGPWNRKLSLKRRFLGTINELLNTYMPLSPPSSQSYFINEGASPILTAPAGIARYTASPPGASRRSAFLAPI